MEGIQKMTLFECHTMGYEMWSWLRDNPTSTKLNWFEFTDTPHIHNNCPCCVYAIDESETTLHGMLDGRVYCNYCPLKELWGVKVSLGYECEYSLTSPYRGWSNCNNQKSRSMYAGRIANAFKVKLDNLKTTEGE